MMNSIADPEENKQSSQPLPLNVQKPNFTSSLPAKSVRPQIQPAPKRKEPKKAEEEEYLDAIFMAELMNRSLTKEPVPDIIQ